MESPVTARGSSGSVGLLGDRLVDVSLGRIRSDPTRHEALKILVGGAKRSGVLRTMIRMMSNEDG